MLESLLQRFMYWRSKRAWLKAMRDLKRELGSSPTAKQIDQLPTVTSGFWNETAT